MPVVWPGSPLVLVRSRLRRVSIRRSAIETVAQVVLAAAGEPRAELSLELVGDRRIRRLNRQYRHQDVRTDVLAFPMRHSSRVTSYASRFTPPELLGDVVISVHTAARQAAAHGHPLDEELVRLLIHGILHLCGYDHERGKDEARRMRRKEQAILRLLGPLPKLVGSQGTIHNAK